jgi:hypothetical protein
MCNPVYNRNHRLYDFADSLISSFTTETSFILFIAAWRAIVTSLGDIRLDMPGMRMIRKQQSDKYQVMGLDG